MQDISVLCEIGGREYNQDCVRFLQKDDKFCIAVADGLGSYNGSEIASQVATEYLVSWFEEHCDKDDLFNKSAVSSALMMAHNKIIEQKSKDSSIASSCTTIAFLVSDTVTSVMAHIGDSRIYEIKNGKILYKTKDHSLAQVAVDRGEISADEISTHQDQNKLLRVLGAEYFVEGDISTDFFALKKGDGFIVCTDGLWEYITDKEMLTQFNLHTNASDIVTQLKAIHDERADDFCDNFSLAVMIKGE